MTFAGVNVLDPLAYPPPTRLVRLWDCEVAWRHVNPARGVFEWDRLDAIVDSLPGRDLMLTLAATPQWAARDPHSDHYASWLGEGSNSPPKRMSDWEDYIRALVMRYRGRIASYQVWNEPALAQFWYPYGAINDLGQMTFTAKHLIRRLDPQAQVVAAQVLPRASSGGMKRSSAYLRALARFSWPVDVYTASVYPEPGKAVASWATMVKAWKAGLKDVNAPRKPLWVAETNYDLLAGPLPENVAGARVRGTMKAAEELGVKRVYWYSWGQHSDPKVLGVRLNTGTAGAKAIQLWRKEA
jgi:hypothetical protein